MRLVAADVLEEDEWRARAARHRERVGPWLDARRARKARCEKHPVHDFLFEYYTFPPARLEAWSPGLGVALRGDTAGFLADPRFARTDEGVALDLDRFPPRRIQAARWILSLLEATSARDPKLGCFGLHEWAMVYKADTVRHPQFPLRLPAPEADALVEQLPVACSHYDAYRFFTAEARPLNRLSPRKSDRAAFEQPGCLHANMDLYKWAYKFHPWIGSDIVADAFLLALDIRELDMRASPYDLRRLGFEPVRIETQEGRAEYARRQKELAGRAAPLRARLALAYRGLIAALT